MSWSGNFSSDADAGKPLAYRNASSAVFGVQSPLMSECAGVIEDAKFKRREALADLAKAVEGKK